MKERMIKACSQVESFNRDLHRNKQGLAPFDSYQRKVREIATENNVNFEIVLNYAIKNYRESEVTL